MNNSFLAKVRWPRPFAGLRGITLADVPREVSAGVTLAALMIPLNIGYAQVAGLPPVVGLYAAIIPLAVFALLASSRHLVTSPDASLAGLVGATLVAFAAPGDPLRLQYALALTLMYALVFFVFWVFRLAFLANFLSRAVMVGFISGLGIEVLTNQVRKILAAPHVAEGGSGVLAAADRLQGAMASSVHTEGYFVELLALIDSIPRANLFSVAIGAGAFLIVRLLKRYAPRVPGALVALVLLTLIVAGFDLADKGVGVLGAIPSGGPDADPARHPPGRLPRAVAGRPGDRGHSSLRRFARGSQLQPQVRLQGRRRSDVVRLRGGQPDRWLHRLVPDGQQPVPLGGDGCRGRAHPAAQPGGGRDDHGGDALLHRHAGLSAQRGPGRDRRQCSVVPDRGSRTPRAVADAPFGVLDCRRLSGQRAGRGPATRSPHRLPPVHHRRHPAGVSSGHIGPAGGP